MQTKLVINGKNTLNGTIAIDTSKNALLPILAGTILTNGITVLKNVPRISDIDNLLRILVNLGIRAEWSNGDLTIDTREIAYNTIDNEIAGKIRGSIFVLGAILGRFGRASVPYPGGCTIGSRPVDLHIQALRDIGARVTERSNVINCAFAKKRKNTNVFLDFPSVGATENLVMACVLGRGRTTIINSAQEPEVEDLCNFLNACGARICGGGTSKITIIGVESLHGVTYTAIPDRINTGSYLIAVAMTGGNVTLTNANPAHNENLLSKLQKAGCEITTTQNTITIKRDPKKQMKSLGSIHTAPYPGFPTDLQSQIATLVTTTRGTTQITENLFENRFKYANELLKLGAKICAKNKIANIVGVHELFAKGETDLYAEDLRGGVALVIASLGTNAKCTVHNAEYIYRGHQSIEKDLTNLGANILRIDV